MKGLFFSLLLSSSLAALTPASAQIQASRYPSRILKGVVQTDTGDPLPGATVVVLGTQAGCTTNSEGLFILSVPGMAPGQESRSAAMLSVSFVGYKSYEVPVRELFSTPKITIVMPASTALKKEVVLTPSEEQALQAQLLAHKAPLTLTLEQLQKLAALPQGLPLHRLTASLLPVGWTYQGAVGELGEILWTAGAVPQPLRAECPADLWLSLRPNGGSLDVLYKTQGTGFEALQRQVRRLRLPFVPVTCPGCEGTRYDAGTYTITFYRNKPQSYPYVVLLKQKSVAAASPGPVVATDAARGSQPRP